MFLPAQPSDPRFHLLLPSLVVCVDCSWTKNQQITATENAYLTRANVRPDGYCLRCPPFQKRRPVLRRTTPARSFRFRAEKKTLTKRPPTEHPASSESSRHWALHRQSGTPSQPVAKRTNERTKTRLSREVKEDLLRNSITKKHLLSFSDSRLAAAAAAVAEFSSLSLP